MNVKIACSMYNVLHTTIWNKINGKAPETTGKIGRSLVLGKQLEAEIFMWIKNTARMGFL